MATESKMTYIQAINNALEVVTDEATKSRLEDLKASLTKKSPKKKVDNSEMEDAIRKALADRPMIPTDLASTVGAPNTQKVAAVVKNMADVTKDVKGKKVTYSLIEE